MSFALAPAAGRHAVRKVHIASSHAPTHNAAAHGLEVSLRHVAQNLLLQRKLSHQPLQPAVLFFQVLQLLRLVQLQPAKFLPPPIVGLFTDPLLAGLRGPVFLYHLQSELFGFFGA